MRRCTEWQQTAKANVPANLSVNIFLSFTFLQPERTYSGLWLLDRPSACQTNCLQMWRKQLLLGADTFVVAFRLIILDYGCGPILAHFNDFFKFLQEIFRRPTIARSGIKRFCYHLKKWTDFYKQSSKNTPKMHNVPTSRKTSNDKRRRFIECGCDEKNNKSIWHILMKFCHCFWAWALF